MSSNRKIKKLNKERNRIARKRTINKDILKISIFVTILFIVMALYLVYYIEFSAPSAINSSYNKRADDYKARTVRGDIYSSDGETLAHTYVDEAGNEYRTYPYGQLFAHSVGFEANGGLGIESSYNFYLLSSNINFIQRIKNEFTGTKNPGNSIYTTLDIGLQQRVDDLLSSAGDSACIALDPDTGEIHAMVSKPGFDPNYINDIWDDITNDEENSTLLNRATQGLYAPGSTFKIFTLTEYLREHPSDHGKYEYDCEGHIDVKDMTLNCYQKTAHGKVDLEGSLAYSCNCSFANIGLELDLNRFRSTNRSLLFDSPLPLDVASSRSKYAMDKKATEPEIIQTSIGQGNTLVTPAHLAIIMSSIATDGKLIKPHMVKSVESAEGVTIKTFKPQSAGNLFSKEEANELQQYLKAVVDYGTANTLAYENFTVYGKTGTAETVSNFNVDTEAKDHSWFVGYAEQDGKKLVVCVLIEKAQDTWGSAAEFSKEIFRYYFN